MPHHTDDATGTSQTPHCCAPKNTSGGTHGACQATRLTFSAQGPNRLCSAGLRVWHLGVEPHVAHLADDLWVPLGSCPVPCQAERQCSFFAAMNHSICSLSHMHSRMLYTLSSRTQCSNSEPAPMTQTCCTAASMTHRTWHDQKLRSLTPLDFTRTQFPAGPHTPHHGERVQGCQMFKSRRSAHLRLMRMTSRMRILRSVAFRWCSLTYM